MLTHVRNTALVPDQMNNARELTSLACSWLQKSLEHGCPLLLHCPVADTQQIGFALTTRDEVSTRITSRRLQNQNNKHRQVISRQTT
eukprot:4806090-Pyramimonas_sp.AAC.1